MGIYILYKHTIDQYLYITISNILTGYAIKAKEPVRLLASIDLPGSFS